MTAAILATVSRNERRAVLKHEARARATGDWPPWEKLAIPVGTGPPDGWLSECRTAYRNSVFSVVERRVAGGVRHLAVTSLSGQRPTWWEMQRIKNELAGGAATAVEVYPPQAEAVDGADMFHIWVLPGPLTFGLRD